MTHEWDPDPSPFEDSDLFTPPPATKQARAGATIFVSLVSRLCSPSATSVELCFQQVEGAGRDVVESEGLYQLKP